MSVVICYVENGKAAPCKHQGRACNPNCPEWEKRQDFLEQIPKPEQPQPEPPIQTATTTPRDFGSKPQPEPENRIRIIEEIIDQMIELLYCDGAYAAGKCPNPETRPCIHGGKACKHLILTIPYFTRKKEQT